MENQEYKVRVEHLTKYFGPLHVLDDVSFNIKKGEFLCVVGPTGCGKTTFLNLLTRIYMPTRGQLYIDNEPADPKKHNLAVVFQEPSSMPWLTVEKNLRFGMEIKKLPKEVIDERVENMIKLLGLEEFRDKYPHQLSVSTAQRIIIGRAFAMQPDLLLMDEPYGQMDIKLRFYLEDEVIRLWKEMGTTVVFITHNIEEAVYLAERVLILTNKPAHIKEEVKVDLPRPRDVASPDFIELRNHITDQIKWKSRFYAYTTYERLQMEWENTITLNISKYISTNIFLYPRFDDGGNYDKNLGYWQFKEYCSLGFSYDF